MRTDRGVSLSVFVAISVIALLVMAGLVVDGTKAIQAHRHAEVVAAQLARHGADASAADRLAGQDAAAAALAAARIAGTNHPELAVSVGLSGGALEVFVETQVETSFLRLIGIDTLRATGAAAADLIGTPPQ